MRYYYITLIFMLFMILISCSGRVDKERRILSDLLGKEILIPDTIECCIIDTPIKYDMTGADFKIITYIDSMGCTPCRMNLYAWKSVIGELMGDVDIEVAFLMIVAADNRTEVELNLAQNAFKFPVMRDVNNVFIDINKLPVEEAYHTLLLDSNNRIVAVGNPAVNPKIREVYRRIINVDKVRDDDRILEQSLDVIGVVNGGDTIYRNIVLHNTTNNMLTIQEIVPSCDCMKMSVSSSVIPPDSSSFLTVSLVADTIPGLFRRHIDIFFNENDNPEQLGLYGFIN